MAQNLTLNVDGKAHRITVDDPKMPLLYALRDDLGFNNPRFGCGLGQVRRLYRAYRRTGGAFLHYNTVSAVATRKITTLAGLGTPEKPHKLQTAWIEEQVNQCAYCISGWIMTGAELLARNPHPTEDEIRDAFSDLICRCGTHNAAIKAVKRAAEKA